MAFGDLHSHMKEKFQAKKAEAEALGCPRSRKADCSSNSAANKAVIYKALREPPVLEERPIPTAQGSQIRIKVTSAALNLVDWKIYKYGIVLEHFPFTGGIDVVGVVDQIGSDVKKFKEGDKVMWQGAWFPNTADINGYQQYAAHDEAFASLIPSNLSEDQAASLPCTAFTAFVGLFDASGLNIPFSPEEPLASGASVPGGILITGGSSTVGKFAIQFARIAGISPIITAASLKHADTLKSLGCTHVIDRTLSQEEQVKQIRDIVGDNLVYCFDAISEEGTQRLARNVLSDSKKSTMSGTLPPTEGIEWPKKPDGSEWKPIFGAALAHPPLAQTFYGNIKTWCEEGAIKVPGDIKVLEGGLAAVVPGLEKLALERPAAKWVVHPQE